MPMSAPGAGFESVSASVNVTDRFVDIFCDTLCRGSRQMDIPLTPSQVDQMACHAAQLEKWNRRINLTAITDPAAMARKHFLDAIAIHPHIHAKTKRLLDMGSGGGFPGLPLKLLNPDIQMVLLDASQKKINFLKHMIRLLGIGGIEAIHGRVEAVSNPRCGMSGGLFDGVLARGFAALDIIAGLAVPLLAGTGTIYALKGPGAGKEITQDLEKRFDVQHHDYLLPFEGERRCLVRLQPKQKSS
jgi:16S rRNA (guanine527-N7)-methyltransferase